MSDDPQEIFAQLIKSPEFAQWAALGRHEPSPQGLVGRTVLSNGGNVVIGVIRLAEQSPGASPSSSGGLRCIIEQPDGQLMPWDFGASMLPRLAARPPGGPARLIEEWETEAGELDRSADMKVDADAKHDGRMNASMLRKCAQRLRDALAASLAGGDVEPGG